MTHTPQKFSGKPGTQHARRAQAAAVGGGTKAGTAEPDRDTLLRLAEAAQAVIVDPLNTERRFPDGSGSVVVCAKRFYELKAALERVRATSPAHGEAPSPEERDEG